MYASEIAYQNPELIISMQEQKLQELMPYLQQHSPYYRDMFAASGIDPLH